MHRSYYRARSKSPSPAVLPAHPTANPWLSEESDLEDRREDVLYPRHQSRRASGPIPRWEGMATNRIRE